MHQRKKPLVLLFFIFLNIFVLARGFLVLINQNVCFETHKVISDGWHVFVLSKLYNTKVILANVYAPNVDNIECIFSLLPDPSSYSLIQGGDLNCWLPNPITLSKSPSFVQSCLSNCGVFDTWHCLSPNSVFSQVHHTYFRIDYFIIDNQWLSSVHPCDYQSIVV